MTDLLEQEAARNDAVRRLLKEQVRSTTSAPPHRRTRVALTAALASVSLILAGVFITTSVHSPRESLPASVPSFDLEAVPDSPGALTFYDSVVFRSPGVLAARSPLAIRGVVREVIEAEALPPGTEAPGFADPVILVLDEVEVLKGQLQPRPDGSVHLAVNGYATSDVGPTLEDWNAAFAAGTEIYALPYRAWRTPLGFGNVRPAGDNTDDDPVYWVMHPQAFAVHAPGSANVAWPLTHDEQPGTLEDALPDGTLIGRM
jgi:hypothetical protein